MAVSLGSPETPFIHSPISHEKDVPSSLIGSRVSMATGTKSWVALMAAYLVCLRSAARSAAAPEVMDVRALWEEANVSGQVTSQVRHLPTFQGTSDIPSSRSPSDLKRPIGFLDKGTPSYWSDAGSAQHVIVPYHAAMRSFCSTSHVCHGRPPNFRMGIDRGTEVHP